MANKKLTFLCLVWMKKPAMAKNNHNKNKIQCEHVFQKSDQFSKSQTIFSFCFINSIICSSHSFILPCFLVTVFLKKFYFDSNSFISSEFLAFSSSKENLAPPLTNSDTVLSSNAFFFLTTSILSWTALR